MSGVTQQSTSERLRSGLADLAEKRYREVHARATSMIKANVNDPVPYCLLAGIAADHGNHVKACELYERAATLAPENPDFLAFHGRALTTLGRQTEAKQVADAAVRFDIRDAFTADMIGVIYSRTGFHTLAVPCFKQAVAMNSKPANFHYNLAASQQFLGEFEAAEAAYKETLKRDAGAYRAWSSLVGLKKQTTDENYLDDLRALFDQLENDADARLHLGHAIAKSLEDMGEYEASFDWLAKAKTLKRSSAEAGQINFAEIFQAAKSSAPPAKLVSDSAIQPIFVIGLPRTGTTLIDRILSSHSEVASAGELNAFPGLIKAATRTPSNLVLDKDTMEQANHIDLSEVGRKYLNYLAPYADGKPLVVDKMPLNFFYAGLISRALPEARIVVLRRGAMDSCLSNYRQLLTVQDSYYSYTYDLVQTAEFYRAFDDLMSFWRESLPSSNLLEVQYEQVVLDQEPETRRLLDFCGLSFEESCMRFHENAAPVSTASSVQVRQPLYSGSIGRWKRYGDRLDGLKQALGALADSPY